MIKSIVVITTKQRKMIFLVAIMMTRGPRRVRWMMNTMIKVCCDNCYHVDQDTEEKVACCNCCEDYDFFEMRFGKGVAKMTVKNIKTIQLNEEERNMLRFAREVLETLNNELSDDDVDELICGLEQIIYSDGWQIEEER